MSEVFAAEFLTSSFPRSEGFRAEQAPDARMSAADIVEAVLRREPVAPEDQPQILRFCLDVLPEPMPDIFVSNALIVSRRVADLLRGFDLGDGYLWPLRYEGPQPKNGTEPHYFGVYVGAIKSSWRPDVSTAKHIRRSRFVIDVPGFFSGEKTVVLDDSAIEGAEMWREPDSATSLVFFSGNLGSALSNTVHPDDKLTLYACHVQE